MPVATRIIYGPTRPAGLTLFQMAAQGCRATLRDVPQGFVLHCRQPMLGAVGRALGPDNIGYLSTAWLLSGCPFVRQRRHGALGGTGQMERQEIKRGPPLGSPAVHDVEIAARRADTIVVQQGLDGRQVNARFQEMGGKGMTQAVDASAFADPRTVFGDMINV